MPLILAGLLAASQVLPFIDRSELRTEAAFEARAGVGSEAFRGQRPRGTRTLATLCDVANRAADMSGTMSGSGEHPLISGRVLAAVKSACAG